MIKSSIRPLRYLWTVSSLIVATFLAYLVVTGSTTLVALVIGGLLALVFFLRPIYAYFAALAILFVNPSLLPPLVEASEFTIRYVDFLFVILAIRFLIGVIVNNGLMKIPSLFAPIGLFLVYIGFSVMWVAITVPNRFAISFASYLRLLETSLLLIFTYLLFQNEKRIKDLVKFLMTMGFISVFIGMWECFEDFRTSGLTLMMVRTEGLLGINSLGIVSGLLVLFSAIRKSKLPARYLFGAIGLFGLLLTKSASSIAATAISTLLYLAYRRSKDNLGSSFRIIIVSLFAMGITVLALWFLRREDITGLLDLSGGSFAHRLYWANVGFNIFLKYPLVGVGWQVSSSPEMLSAPDINAPLRTRFWRFPEYYFADPNIRSSVHNMYVQFLAELGIIGFILFVVLAFKIWKKARKVINKFSEETVLKAYTKFFAFGLIFLLIWWNTNPLYGGPIELAMAMVFLGGIAAIEKIMSQKQISA